MLSPVRCVTPHALVDMVIMKPWTIVDLVPDVSAAPYALHALPTPQEMVKDAQYKNIALLYESHSDAMDTVHGLLEEEFPHNIALVERSAWLAYWASVDGA